jgi:hypothetical protein
VLHHLSRSNTDPSTNTADPYLAVPFHKAFGTPQLAFDGPATRFVKDKGSDTNLGIIKPVEKITGPRIAPAR